MDSSEANPPQYSSVINGQENINIPSKRHKKHSTRRRRRRHKPRHWKTCNSSDTARDMPRPSPQEESSRLTFGNARPTQFSQFWDSYSRAFEWQNNNQIAYWKSRVIALEHENAILRSTIEGKAHLCQPNTQRCEPFRPTQQPHYRSNESMDQQTNKRFMHMPMSTNQARPRPSTSQCESTRLSQQLQNQMFAHDPSCGLKESNKVKAKELVSTRPRPSSMLTAVQKSEDTDNSLEFEVDEEMLAFLEQSMKHKIELSNQRESERLKIKKEQLQLDYESSLPPQHIGKQRIKEMNLLYGKDAPKIIAMETSMKLTFERRIQKDNASFWPVIPLKP